MQVKTSSRHVLAQKKNRYEGVSFRYEEPQAPCLYIRYSITYVVKFTAMESGV